MQDRHINKDYKIIIQLCILAKIPIVKINITKTKLEKLKIKEKMQKIDINVLKDDKEFDKKILKAIKEAKIIIKKMNLNSNSEFNFLHKRRKSIDFLL